MEESKEAREAHERRVAERYRQRHVLSLLEGSFALVLLLSTALAYENHPRAMPDPHHPGVSLVREVSHTVGTLTMPAGPIIVFLALVALLWYPHLTSGKKKVGWSSLIRALLVLGVLIVELIQLLLGRRDWMDHHPTLSNAVESNAVGAGVWVGLAAAVGLVIVAWVYLWRAYGSWQDSPSSPSKKHHFLRRT